MAHPSPFEKFFRKTALQFSNLNDITVEITILQSIQVMRKTFLSLLTAITCLHAFSQGAPALPAIIPEPVSQQVSPGHFVLPASILVEAPDQPGLAQTVQDLRTHLSVPTGFTVTISARANPDAAIRLVLNNWPDLTARASYLNVMCAGRPAYLRAADSGSGSSSKQKKIEN